MAVFAMLITIGSSAHLRNYEQNHEFMNLGSMNPLQIAGLLSGDWTSILPASIQPFVRTLLGKEQQSGVSGFLSKAQGLLGGNGGGLLGGMGNLFGQASQQGQSGLSGLLNNFGGALGGSGANLGQFGLPNLPNIPSFGGINANTAGGLSGLLNQVGLSHE